MIIWAYLGQLWKYVWRLWTYWVIDHVYNLLAWQPYKFEWKIGTWENYKSNNWFKKDIILDEAIYQN